MANMLVVLKRVRHIFVITLQETYSSSWNRFKLTGPDANRYWVAHDTRMGSSDADDA